MKKDPNKVKKLFGKKTILFAGEKGYFTVNFNEFDRPKMVRFRRNLNILFSNQTINEIEEDNLDGEISNEKSSKAAKTAMAVDIIEKTSHNKISINNVKSTDTMAHLSINKKLNVNKSDSSAI